MKKTLLATSLCLAFQAQADFFYVELDGYVANTNSSISTDDYQTDIAIRAKHPLPLIPNVALGATDRSQGDVADGSTSYGELYYNLWGSLGLDLDVGLGYEKWEADKTNDDGDHLFASGRVSWELPFLNLGAMASAQVPVATNDYEKTQIRLGLTYSVWSYPNIRLAAGYQYEKIDVLNFDEDNSGLFLNTKVRF